jgi:hypothetical protein
LTTILGQLNRQPFLQLHFYFFNNFLFVFGFCATLILPCISLVVILVVKKWLYK